MEILDKQGNKMIDLEARIENYHELKKQKDKMRNISIFV